MSRRIAKLLAEPEIRVTKLISELETKNGYPSHDARLIAGNIQKVRSKITDLGLDPDDTTSQELYHALLAKFRKDSAAFDENFEAGNLNFDDSLTKAIELVEKNVDLPHRWSLKKTAAKTVLRQHPPKHVMKALRYRSLESMLKRENVPEIYIAAQVLESATWQKAQFKLVSNLDQTNFELKPVKVIVLNSRKWQMPKDPDLNVIHDNSIAAFAVWPSDEAPQPPLLSIILLILEEYGKYQQIDLAGSLSEMSGILNWWADMDHCVAELSGECVSLSLRDNASNLANNNSYDDRSLAHARLSFWQELVSRYDNLLLTEGVFNEPLRTKIEPIKFSAPDPAYEFAEDF